LLPDQPIRDPLTGSHPLVVAQARSLAAGRALRVLLVGRRATGDALATIVAKEGVLAQQFAPPGFVKQDGAQHGTSGDGQDPPQSLPSLQIVTLTNQKMALQEIRMQPPKVVLVELEDKVESRRRFCDMVRYRLPTALIFAVCMAKPQSTFAFDRVLQLPLRHEEVAAALQGIDEEVDDYVLQRGPIRLNVATRTVVSVNGQRHMTPKQCALLQYLMVHANQVVKRGDIMEAIWETNYLDDTRTLDVHIRWLRECIEPDPSQPVYLVTERGQGYQLKIPT
jgi:DNA-binding response OmpR family regulator